MTDSSASNSPKGREYFDGVLRQALELGASDIHLKAGLPPVIRMTGSLRPVSREAVRMLPQDTLHIARNILSERQWNRFEEMEEVDCGYGVAGVGRFRLNVFRQRGAVSIVARAIPHQVKTVDELHLPAILKKISSEPRGLILVTGATGSGKSTTLAALIQEINTTRTTHIITIEDPIEFLIRDRKSIITQREISLDTRSFAAALRHALRQDPDVILVGEMRDPETINTVLMAAETGHLVLSTLHTNDATESVNRIISSYPSHQHEQIRVQLASVLKAIVCQRLVPRKDGSGLTAALEILLVNSRMRELILDPRKTSQMQVAIEESHHMGMQSFDQALMQLVKQGVIHYQDALDASTNPADFELRYKGVASMDGAKWSDFDGGVNIRETTSATGESLPRTPVEVETQEWHQKTQKKRA